MGREQDMFAPQPPVAAGQARDDIAGLDRADGGDEIGGEAGDQREAGDRPARPGVR